MAQRFNVYCKTCHIFVKRNVPKSVAENAQHVHAEQEHGKNLKHVPVIPIKNFE